MDAAYAPWVVAGVAILGYGVQYLTRTFERGSKTGARDARIEQLEKNVAALRRDLEKEEGAKAAVENMGRERVRLLAENDRRISDLQRDVERLERRIFNGRERGP